MLIQLHHEGFAVQRRTAAKIRQQALHGIGRIVGGIGNHKSDEGIRITFKGRFLKFIVFASEARHLLQHLRRAIAFGRNDVIGVFLALIACLITDFNNILPKSDSVSIAKRTLTQHQSPWN